MTTKKNGVKFTSVHPGNITTGMFEGFALNWLGRLIAPPVKDHDLIAKGIVEKGLKKQRHLVVIPWQIYIVMIIRGIVPSFILTRISLLVGLGSCVNNFQGRKGFIHSTAKVKKE
jgi:hypothetical protein